MWEYTYGRVDKDVGYIKFLIDLLLSKEAYSVLGVFISGLKKGIEASPFTKEEINKIETILENRLTSEKYKYEEGSRDYILLDNLIGEIVGIMRW